MLFYMGYNNLGIHATKKIYLLLNKVNRIIIFFKRSTQPDR